MRPIDSRDRVRIVTDIVETVYCHTTESSGAVQLKPLAKNHKQSEPMSQSKVLTASSGGESGENCL